MENLENQNMFLHQYPETPRIPSVRHFETSDGTYYLEDPYAWLVNYKKSSEETENFDEKVENWIEQQNAYTDEYLRSIGTVEAVRERLEQIRNSGIFKTVPQMHNTSLTWYQQNLKQENRIVMWESVFSKEPVILINPEQYGKDVAVSWYILDPSETYVAYAIQCSGNEMNNVFIKDIKSDQAEFFYQGQVFDMAWDPDGQGFMYTKSNFEAHDTDDDFGYQQVYHHTLGTLREKDTLLFDIEDHGLPSRTWLGVEQSEDGSYLMIQTLRGRGGAVPYMISLKTGETKQLLDGAEGLHRGRFIDDYVYVTTTNRADNKRVIRIPISDAHLPIESWEELLPEWPGHQLLQLGFSKEYVIVEYSYNVASEVLLLDRATGEFCKQLDIPPLSSLRGLSTHPNKSEFYYSISNYLMLDAIYKNDGGQSNLEWHKSKHAFDPEKTAVCQEWITIGDGIQMPVAIVSQKDALRKEPLPLWIAGYGGFANGEYPDSGHDDLRRTWVEQGGAVAIMALPGGDEFGESWHQMAVESNKPNTFKAAIAFMEYAIDTGITTPDKLILSGGSNGGLMVAACIAQRPDLMKAVDCRVPLIDMLDYTNYPPANLWIKEYGDPNNPEHLSWLYGYSPYHNFDPTKELPSTFITARLRDTIVHPVHSFKWAALLQSVPNHNPILLRADANSGHHNSKGFSHRIAHQAERLAFLMHQVGIEPNFNER